MWPSANAAPEGSACARRRMSASSFCMRAHRARARVSPENMLSTSAASCAASEAARATAAASSAHAEMSAATARISSSIACIAALAASLARSATSAAASAASTRAWASVAASSRSRCSSRSCASRAIFSARRRSRSALPFRIRERMLHAAAARARACALLIIGSTRANSRSIFSLRMRRNQRRPRRPRTNPVRRFATSARAHISTASSAPYLAKIFVWPTANSPGARALARTAVQPSLGSMDDALEALIPAR